MATYYWVATSGGTWDTTTTTNWASTSGGTGGAGVPGSADTAIFDGSSGSNTITTTGSTAISVTSLTLNNGFTGTVTFANSFTASGPVTLSQGTLKTNGQTCSWGNFAATTTQIRTLTMGASAITLSASATVWNVNSSNLTITANTATVTFTAPAMTFYPGSGTYSGTTFVFNGTGACTIENNLSCANLTYAPTSGNANSLNLAGGVTLSGTLTLTGAAPPNRIVMQSSVVGTARSVVCNGTVTASYVDFIDITASGTASWNLAAITGGSGDGQGNSGITFTSEADQTWNGNTTGNWSNASNWTSRVPLPQDNATISGLTSGTVTADMPRVGKNVTFNGSTGGTWSISTSPIIVFGSLTQAAGLTVNVNGGAKNLDLFGRSSGQTLNLSATTSNPWGASNSNIVMNAPGGTYTLQSNLTTTQLELGPGTFNANGYAVAAAIVYTLASVSVTLPLTVNMSTSAWTITNYVTTQVPWNFPGSTGVSLNSGTSTLTLAIPSGAGVRTYNMGSYTYNNVVVTNVTSGAQFIFTGSPTIANFSFHPSVASTLTFTSNTTTTFTSSFTVSGNSGSVVTLNASTAGTQATLSYTGSGFVSCSYLSIQDSKVTQTNTWYAGTSSVSVSNNTNWLFTSPPSNGWWVMFN